MPINERKMMLKKITVSKKRVQRLDETPAKTKSRQENDRLQTEQSREKESQVKRRSRQDKNSYQKQKAKEIETLDDKKPKAV